MFTRVLKIQNSVKNKFQIIPYLITFEISIIAIGMFIFLSVFFFFWVLCLYFTIVRMTLNLQFE